MPPAHATTVPWRVALYCLAGKLQRVLNVIDTFVKYSATVQSAKAPAVKLFTQTSVIALNFDDFDLKWSGSADVHAIALIHGPGEDTVLAVFTKETWALKRAEFVLDIHKIACASQAKVGGC